MKKKAFTLSEVLITLGIIGVIAAFTIPSLITMYQKRAAVSGIREALSILSQAVRMYSAESGDEGSIYFDTSLPVDEFARKYFLPYLNVARVCTRMSDGCWTTGNFNGYYDLAGVRMTHTVPYSIVLNNGMVFGFNKVNDGAFHLISVIVDINGKSARNQMGKDVFSFYLFNNDFSLDKTTVIANGIYPGGYGGGGVPHIQYTRAQLLDKNIPRGCNKDATSFAYNGDRPGVGTACAAVIFKDGWKISSDYPWN